MRKLLTAFSFVLFGVLIFSCGETSHPYGDIIAYKYNHGFRYELQLPYHVEGRGNVHQLNLKRYAYEDADWFYLDTLHGRISAQAFVFTFYQRKTEYPWKKSNIEGYIDFLNGTTVTVNFQFFDSARTSQPKPYRLNGTYKLIIRQDTAAVIERD
jgi:hypothetical protein